MQIAVIYYPIVPNDILELKDMNGPEIRLLPSNLTLPLRIGRKIEYPHTLLLVLSEKGDEIPVKYGISRFTDLSLAITNLSQHGRCNTNEIGFIDLQNNKTQSRVTSVAERIKEWAGKNKFDAAIWIEGTENPKIIGNEKELLRNNYYLMVHTKDYLRKTENPLPTIHQEILAMVTPPIPKEPCAII